MGKEPEKGRPEKERPEQGRPEKGRPEKGRPEKGRVVWNHSTHLPGLIPILERLAQQSGIETITPAVIGQTRANIAKLQIKVSVPIRGGFKLIARKGKTFQEVFVLTALDQPELEAQIAALLDKGR